MKFAFSTLACPNWSTEQVIEHAVQMGYDGVELRLLDGKLIDPVRDADEVGLAATHCHAHGLDVCALDTSCTLNQSTPEGRAEQVRLLRAWIRLAQDAKAPVLRVFGGASSADLSPQPTPEQEDAWVVEILREVAAEAEEAKVTIALETHDAYASARRVAGVIEAVGSPAVGALWDSHHPYRVGESAQDVVAALGSHIVHYHAKDAIHVPESSSWQLVLLGEGEVPVQEQLQLLLQHGYQGYISVEWEKRWHPELAEPEIALPQHIVWLKRFAEAVAE